MTWRDKYRAVISSRRWRLLKDRRAAKTDNRCERCGWQKTQWSKGRDLELHHTTYERLGVELDEDVEILCDDCHRAADTIRAKAGQQKSRKALYEAKFDGWARKVYGEDYRYAVDGYMHERFMNWLERQQH